MDRIEENIKTRLRNNSGTPKKLRKDATPSKSGKHLKRLYEAEGKKMEQFLNKASEIDDNEQDVVSIDQRGGVNSYVNTSDKDNQSDTDEEVCLKKVNNAHSPEADKDLQLKSVNATSKKQLASNIRIASNPVPVFQAPRKEKMASTEEKRAHDELSVLESKLAKVEVGSMEHMLLEMRVDMKRDNITMIKKIDNVSNTSDTLQKEIKKLKTDYATLETGLTYTQENASTEKVRVDQVQSGLNNMREQVRILQGVVQMHAQKHEILKLEKEKQKLYETRNNILISGLDEEDTDVPTESINTNRDGTENENETETETATTTAEMVTDFFTQIMKIPTPIAITSATRIGKANPRTILVALKNAKDKGTIFKHVGNLKTAKNSKDGGYYINNQLPPRLQEQQRWYRMLIKFNAGLTGIGKRELKMKNGELLVDGHLYRPPVQAPTVQEAVFPLDENIVSSMQLFKGDVQNKGRCHFVGYAINAYSVGDVRAAYTKVKRMNPNAMHISCAFRIAGTDFVSLRGIEDDGEDGAGRTIYQVLEDQNIFNRAIYVVRYYGNKHLGPARFQLIGAAAKTALMKCKEPRRPQQYISALPPGPAIPQWSAMHSEGNHDEATKGYARAASPRPFPTLTHKPIESWGSRESMISQVGEKETVHGSLRSRANSLDSNTSYGSVSSERITNA